MAHRDLYCSKCRTEMEHTTISITRLNLEDDRADFMSWSMGLLMDLNPLKSLLMGSLWKCCFCGTVRTDDGTVVK